MAKPVENHGDCKAASADTAAKPDGRKARLEAALRANLRRRKQSVKSASGDTDTP